MEASVVTRLVLVLVALHCLAFIDRTMIGGALPLLRQGIAMSDAQAGWIVGTAFALPYGATALLVAALRRGRPASTPWLVAGVLVWTGGSLATGMVHSLSSLTMARAALGIGQGIFVPVAIARLLDSTAPDARSRALGWFTGGSTAGRSVALLTVGSLLSAIALVVPGSGVAAWRWLFVVTAMPNLLVVMLLTGSPAASPQPAARVIPVERPDWRALLPMFLVAVMPVILAQAVLGWLPTLFVRERGLSATTAALLLGVVTLFAAPAGPIVAGWLIGRRRRWEAHMPVIVLAALVVTLVPLAGLIWASTLPAAVASMVAMLLTLGTASFGGLFGVQLLIPPSARVSVNGIYLAFATIVGLGAGPLLAGALSAASGSASGGLGRALLITGTMTCGACAVAVALATGPYRQARRA